MKERKESELAQKIVDLKRKRRAVILAHNYELGEIQDVADFVGDSLELSQLAAQTDAEVVVFCGVKFMAETAAILCPDKKVVLPELQAGCSLADMATAEEIRMRKRENPHLKVICYVNSSAEVKAESDICCTSANAAKVVEALKGEEILFVPDQHLGHYASIKTGKELNLWSGFCHTHVRIKPEDIIRLRKEYPQAKVVVHPECQAEVVDLADEVASTAGICRYAARGEVKELIVGTEIGILHRLRKENPGKRFLPASEQAICPFMKLITLEKLLYSLEELTPQVKVPEQIRIRAKAAVDRMLEIG